MCDNLYLHVLGHEQKACEGLIERRDQQNPTTCARGAAGLCQNLMIWNTSKRIFRQIDGLIVLTSHSGA